MKPIAVTLEKSKETKGTYRFDSLDPNAAITSIYVRKSAFDVGKLPKHIVLTVQRRPNGDRGSAGSLVDLRTRAC